MSTNFLSMVLGCCSTYNVVERYRDIIYHFHILITGDYKLQNVHKHALTGKLSPQPHFIGSFYSRSHKFTK